MNLFADDFVKELETLLEQGQSCGFVAVEVRAGNLHRRLGGYPGFDHRMPLCCDVMRQAMRVGDVIVTEANKGREADLTIRYRLPR